jgi:hypothetical protein
MNSLLGLLASHSLGQIPIILLSECGFSTPVRAATLEIRSPFFGTYAHHHPILDRLD